MPRSTREYLKRYCDQIINNHERAAEIMVNMLEMYGDRYPEHTTFLQNMLLVNVSIIEAFNKFRDEMI